jgi:hypothetical protein
VDLEFEPQRSAAQTSDLRSGETAEIMTNDYRLTSSRAEGSSLASSIFKWSNLE